MNVIIGIGMDLCDIGRMGRAVEKAHFVDRVFAPAEAGRIRAAGGARRAEIAAGLFAAKEAVAKALGTGFAGFGPADVEIGIDAAGRPACALHRGARQRADALCGEGGRWAVWVSITHEAGVAGAVAVLERTEEVSGVVDRQTLPTGQFSI